MRYHIIGPMTGIQHYNVSAFTDAIATIFSLETDERIEITTPFTACNTVWNRHHARDFEPYRDTCDYGDPLMQEMLEEDVKLIMRADIIAVLPHWPISKGTGREMVIANYLGKTIVSAVDLSPLFESIHPYIDGEFVIEWSKLYGRNQTTNHTTSPIQGTLQDSARARSAGD